MPRRTSTDAAESRASAIETAVDLASIEGLEGITIGRLASALGMSKSGLIGRFGDKQALQRAVLDAAIQRFTAAVWEPASRSAPGLVRLEAIIDAWITHLRDGVFPGGCFVTTASVEYDARPGALHDDVARAVRRWLVVLEAEAHHAHQAGHLPADRDAADIALELHSLASGGSVASRLTADPTALDRTRAAMRRTIGLPVSVVGRLGHDSADDCSSARAGGDTSSSVQPTTSAASGWSGTLRGPAARHRTDLESSAGVKTG